MSIRTVDAHPGQRVALGNGTGTIVALVYGPSGTARDTAIVDWDHGQTATPWPLRSLSIAPLTAAEIDAAVRARLLSPAARDMSPDEILWQYTETHCLSIAEAVAEIRSA